MEYKGIQLVHLKNDTLLVIGGSRYINEKTKKHDFIENHNQLILKNKEGMEKRFHNNNYAQHRRMFNPLIYEIKLPA